MQSLKSKLSWDIVPYLLLLPALWLFYATAVSTSWARVASLQTIEPYAMAVHEQLMRNFSETGSWFQTVHRGYDDAWTWSGHRALTLPIAGWFYGWNPSALWLSKILILGVMSGAVPAGLIARRQYATVGNGHWAFLWGALVYLSMPGTMAIALQDYQDLCFALPFLVWTWNFFESGWLIAAIFGALFGIAPREETIPMAIFCAVMARPMFEGVWQWKQHLRNLLVVIGIAGFYVWWAQAYHPLDSGGHDMPLQNALGSLGQQRVFLEGWVYHTRFYALVFIPLGLLAWCAPLVAAPAVALCVLHMSVPDGHGVDRSWSGHCHHMAPALAFSTIAIVTGGTRVGKWLTVKRFGKWKWLLPAVLAIGSLGWSRWWWLEWADYYNLVLSTSVEEPEWTHPAWTLKDTFLENQSEDAILVVNKNTALIASDQLRSYTLDESIFGKEPRKGLGAGDRIIFDERRRDISTYVQRMQGAEQVSTEEVFGLWCWPATSVDTGVMTKPRFKPAQVYTGMYKKGSDIPGTAPREQKISAPMGSFPVVNLDTWSIEGTW